MRRFTNPPPPRGLSAEEYRTYTKAIIDLREVLEQRERPVSVEEAVTVLKGEGWTCAPPTPDSE